MYPESYEFRVGPSGFTVTRDGSDVRYEPGALVWLRSAPAGADLQPTGRSRRYETKDEPHAVGGHGPELIIPAGEPHAIRKPRRRRR